MFDEQKKTYKVRSDTEAAVEVGENWAALNSSDPSSFVSVAPGGTTVGGDKVLFQQMSHDIKIGGLSSFNFWPLLFIPSTPVTPIPVLKPSLPLEALKPLISTVIELKGLIT